MITTLTKRQLAVMEFLGAHPEQRIPTRRVAKAILGDGSRAACNKLTETLRALDKYGLVVRWCHGGNQISKAGIARLSSDEGRTRSPEQVQSECGCGPCGSAETYATQVWMPLGSRVRGIDKCIHDIVAALNAANVPTVGSCCGHGKMDGRITLEDGRELLVVLPGVREVK